MSFLYYMPTKLLFGKGALEKLHKQQLPGKRALIVISAGKSIKSNGYLERLTAQLEVAEISYVVYDKILSNPLKTHVMEGAAIAKQEQCDFVIGFGGGSSIDSAKAIAVMASNEGDFWDYIFGGTGKKKPVLSDPLPVVAITTTAGTGTEADPWMVITNGQEKIGFGYDKTFPVLSVIDPDLMMSIPPDFTAYQGFDALFHSVEGYLHTGANEMSDLFALKSISLIGESITTAVNDGSNEIARANMALANTLAGIVETTSGCISQHSIEHALSAHHPKLPHGAGLIMLSKAYFTFLAQSGSCNQRLIEAAKALGKSDASSPMDFVLQLTNLQKECGVDQLRMSSYGITEIEFESIANNAIDTMGNLFRFDPCKITEKDIVEIVRQSYR